MAKVFDIGLPKTGTNSLHTALGILGYRSVHFPLTTEDIDGHDTANDITVACRFEEDETLPESCELRPVKYLNNIFKTIDLLND